MLTAHAATIAQAEMNRFIAPPPGVSDDYRHRSTKTRAAPVVRDDLRSSLDGTRAETSASHCEIRAATHGRHLNGTARQLPRATEDCIRHTEFGDPNSAICVIAELKWAFR
jgi:hypothetical protein